MGYEDQLRQMERIVDKMNAARQPSGDVQKRLSELEEIVVWVTVFCIVGWVILLIHIF